MRKEVLAPLAALVLGAGGFALRKWELATAFEPDTGLVTPGMPSTIALIVLSVAAALLLFFLVRGQYYPFPGGYDEAFSVSGDTLTVTALVLAAFLMAGSGLWNLYLHFLAKEAVFPVTRLLQSVLSVVSAGAVFYLAARSYRGQSVGKYPMGVLAPGYTFCLWLTASYQNRAADPVVQDYLYELLAIICALLATYYIASFAFAKKKKVTNTLFFGLLTVYFILTTLADSHDGPTMLLYGGALLYVLTMSYCLLRAEGQPHPDPVPEAAPQEEPQVESSNREDITQ